MFISGSSLECNKHVVDTVVGRKRRPRNAAASNVQNKIKIHYSSLNTATAIAACGARCTLQQLHARARGWKAQEAAATDDGVLI